MEIIPTWRGRGGFLRSGIGGVFVSMKEDHQVDLMNWGKRQQANASTWVLDLAKVNERVLVVHQEYEQRKRDGPSGA